MIDENPYFFEFFNVIDLGSDFMNHSGHMIKESFKYFQIMGAMGDK